MIVKGKVFQNHKNGKFYYVYRVTSNFERTILFVHLYQVRGWDNTKMVNKDRYYTEEMKDFLKHFSDQEDTPPPIDNLR